MNKNVMSIREVQHRERGEDEAHFEHIAIPLGQSFLWRMDDYPWRRCVWNYHPEFELHLIRYSSGICYVGDYIGNFDAGQLVLVGGNLPHNWVTPLLEETSLPLRDIVAQFEPERFLARCAELPETTELKGLFNETSLGLEFYGTTAVQGGAMLEQIGAVSGLARLGRFMELLSLLAHSRERRALATPEFVGQFRGGNPNEMRMVQQALDFLHRQFLKSPGLSEVAAKFHMSESQFSRFFKAHTGNTFTDHINGLKLWKARSLLSGSKMPITEICYESGFTNISNFNRTFLSKIGLTPSDYRKASRRRNVRIDTEP